MAKVGPRLWIARIMLTWGLCGVAASFATGPYSFYTTRFLLGAAEAGFFPGAVFYLALWFPIAYRSRVMAAFGASGMGRAACSPAALWLPRCKRELRRTRTWPRSGQDAMSSLTCLL